MTEHKTSVLVKHISRVLYREGIKSQNTDLTAQKKAQAQAKPGIS